MKVINLLRLDPLARVSPEVKTLTHCRFQIAKQAAWASIEDVQYSFPQQILLDGDWVLFLVANGKYLIRTKIDFVNEVVYIRATYTEAEYKREQRKKQE